MTIQPSQFTANYLFNAAEELVRSCLCVLHVYSIDWRVIQIASSKKSEESVRGLRRVMVLAMTVVHVV